jgi:hypothetical protein
VTPDLLRRAGSPEDGMVQGLSSVRARRTRCELTARDQVGPSPPVTGAGSRGLCQPGYFVSNSAASCFPTSSTEVPFCLSCDARACRSLMNARSRLVCRHPVRHDRARYSAAGEEQRAPVGWDPQVSCALNISPAPCHGSHVPSVAPRTRSPRRARSWLAPRRWR